MTNHVSSVRTATDPRLAKHHTPGRLTRGLLGLAAVACASVPATNWAQSFANPASIDIPINTVTQGPGSLYPSPVTVSGVGTSLTNLTVTFFDLSHAYPDDIDVLLVGPGGQNVLLMSDAGGLTPISGLTLTFSDAAAGSLPDTSGTVAAPIVLTSGTYKPTNYDAPFTVDSFAPPAPLTGPYGSTLSVFNGTNPNGVWNLYVLDDTQGNNGVMAGGWSLTVSATAIPEPSSFALGACALAAMGWVTARRRMSARS